MTTEKTVKNNLIKVITQSHKNEMVAYVKSNDATFSVLLSMALSHNSPYAWRASWLLWSCMEKNDQRLFSSLPKIIDLLPQCKQNQQRELLLVLQRMTLLFVYG